VTVVKGELEALGPGREVQERRRGVVRRSGDLVIYREGRTRVHWVRDFVDVGGQRITTLSLSRYQDSLLQEAIGQPVTLNFAGWKKGRNRWVVSLRTPRAFVKSSMFRMLLTAIWQLLILTLGGVFMTICLLLLGWFIVVPVLTAIHVLGAVPGTDSETVRQQVSDLLHYWPFDVTWGLALAFFLYACVIAPILVVTDVLRVTVGTFR
jgi:hypothetical protein